MAKKKTTRKPTAQKVRIKKTNTATSAARKAQPKSKSMDPAIRREVCDLLILLVLIVLFLSLCLDSTFGVFGSVVHEVFVGSLGIGAFLICILGIGLIVYDLVHAKDQEVQIAKFIFAFLFILATTLLMHILCSPEQKTLQEWYTQARWYTGGVVGGALGSALSTAIGKAGAIIVAIGVMIISVVVITGKSLIKALKAGIEKAKAVQPAEEKAKAKEKPQLRPTAAAPKPTVLPKPTVTTEPKKEAPRPTAMIVETPKPAADAAPVDVNGKPAQKRADAVTEKEQNKMNKSIQRNLFNATDVPYVFPSLDLLSRKQGSAFGNRDMLYRKAQELEQTLMSFGVEAHVTQVNQGPAVTRYELVPREGIRVNRITNLSDDIALSLAAKTVRIEAPIPGKSAIGIEIPNDEAATVVLREVLESEQFRNSRSKLSFALGETIDGEPTVADIAKMPHLLIAGATGSGKSVCINSILISLLYHAGPDDVKLILVDPKVVELQIYNGIPHLLTPVVNDPKKAAATLNWAVHEMEERYKRFAEYNVRDINGYNQMRQNLAHPTDGTIPQDIPHSPSVVIIIDELADLMMVAGKEVETAICRLTQMGRAAGMHLVIATQRPSVDVITGLIKANVPSRIAFAVSSGIDSRTILDGVGAERLLGRGDMLFMPIGANKPMRIQGTFVSDAEVERVVAAVKAAGKAPDFDPELRDRLSGVNPNGPSEGADDEFLQQAIESVVAKQKCSISALQREFRIGFNRAARLVEDLEKRGIVGPDEGMKPRKVLVTLDELNQMKFADEDFTPDEEAAEEEAAEDIPSEAAPAEVPSETSSAYPSEEEPYDENTDEITAIVDSFFD